MYTIKQASLRSGVGIPLLRAWERRYGVVRPVRTPAGYRLYDEAAIHRLRAMRQLVEAGWSPREAAPRVMAASEEELGNLISPATSGPSAATGPEAAALARGIVEAAATMDQERLEAALDAAFARVRFEPAVEEILMPALAEVGAAWARGEVDVAAEHAASASVLRRLGAAFQAAGGRATGPTVLVGLPPGAHHELAALAFATAARRSGLDVVYLGPDVPAESWVHSVAATRAAAVVLGAVMLRDAQAADSVVAELQRQHPGILVAAGGRHADAVSSESVRRLPEPVSQAVAALREALDQPTS